MSQMSCIAGLVACGVVSTLTLPFPFNVYGALLGYAAVSIAVADLSLRIVPDFHVAAIFIGGLIAILSGASPSIGDVQGSSLLSRMSNFGLTAVLVGGGLLTIAGVFRWATGKEGLGLGDTKLLVAWSSWLPFGSIVDAITFAALAAIVIFLGAKWRDPTDATVDRFPFAAVLAPTLWLVWVVTHWTPAG